MTSSVNPSVHFLVHCVGLSRGSSGGRRGRHRWCQPGSGPKRTRGLPNPGRCDPSWSRDHSYSGRKNGAERVPVEAQFQSPSDMVYSLMVNVPCNTTDCSPARSRQASTAWYPGGRRYRSMGHLMRGTRGAAHAYMARFENAAFATLLPTSVGCPPEEAAKLQGDVVVRMVG